MSACDLERMANIRTAILKLLDSLYDKKVTGAEYTLNRKLNLIYPHGSLPERIEDRGFSMYLDVDYQDKEPILKSTKLAPFALRARDPVPLLNHDCENPTYTQKTLCDGTTTFVCDKCGKKAIRYPGHNWEAWR
jgi:hypothetical protein